MKIMEHLHQLAVKSPDQRRLALEQALIQEQLAFTQQELPPTHELARQDCNYLLTPWQQQPAPLFCAHYDAVADSFGANDNAAALCVLIALAQALKTRHIPAYFAFFDGEESGRTGSRFYAQQLDRQLITAVINLDLCGYGDHIAVYDHGNAKKSAVASFFRPSILSVHHAVKVPYLPPSDDESFARLSVPVISIACVPHWDIQYLHALSKLGSGLFGQPPEFQLILEQMEITSTMHGGFRDTPASIDPAAMNRVYEYLLAALQPPESKTSSNKKESFFQRLCFRS